MSHKLKKYFFSVGRYDDREKLNNRSSIFELEKGKGCYNSIQMHNTASYSYKSKAICYVDYEKDFEKFLT